MKTKKNNETEIKIKENRKMTMIKQHHCERKRFIRPLLLAALFFFRNFFIRGKNNRSARKSFAQVKESSMGDYIVITYKNEDKRERERGEKNSFRDEIIKVREKLRNSHRTLNSIFSGIFIGDRKVKWSREMFRQYVSKRASAV